jgi:starvation-inducible outer membrane lipoprotein
MKSLPMVVLAVALASLACGCDAQPAAVGVRAPASAEVAQVTRDAAIRTARSDATVRFGGNWITYVDAQNLGRYWVVELRAQSGAGVRYAISTNDGSIRERNLFQ